MRKFLLILLFTVPLSVFSAEQKVIEIPVKGMSCPFCAYGVEKHISKMPSVEKCEVSSTEGIARITLAPGVDLDVQALKSAVIDSGFSPGEATVKSISK